MTRTFKYYVLTTQLGRMVGIDQNSGGYPYIVDDIEGAKLFRKLEDAVNYNSMFKDHNYRIGTLIAVVDNGELE